MSRYILRHYGVYDANSIYIAVDKSHVYDIKHHGILGQKWGVRRYQNKDGSLTSEGLKQQRYNRSIRRARSKGSAKTEGIKKYNVGLTEFTRPDGSKYTSGLTNGHDFDWVETFNGKSAADPDLLYEGDDWVKKNCPNRSITSNICQLINPGYGLAGTTQNCAKASSTIELALHGYTACAGRQSFPSTSDAPEYWWKGAKAVQYDDNSCEDALKGYGPGTSGTISIKYPGTNAGHAMHWTNDTNGKFTVEDGQNGRMFGSIREMASTYGADTSAGYTTYRLDNCEPDWDHMAQDSVVRIGSSKDRTPENNSMGLRRASNPDSAQVYNRWEDRYVGRW
jgi:hypothetical protein